MLNYVVIKFLQGYIKVKEVLEILKSAMSYFIFHTSDEVSLKGFHGCIEI